jgi:phosphatidylglycerophosphate synthase
VFDPALRKIKDVLLASPARGLGLVHPGWLTLLGFGLGVGSAAHAWGGRFGLALIFWLANRTLDGLDGAVARLHGKSSDLGGLLDLVADFAVYAAIPLALALRPGADPALPAAAALLLGAFYVNTAAWLVPSAILERRKRGVDERGEPTSVVIPEGLVSGGETILFYCLFFLLPHHQVLLFRTMAALTAVTVVQRLVWAFSEFRGAKLTSHRQAPRPPELS